MPIWGAICLFSALLGHDVARAECVTVVCDCALGSQPADSIAYRWRERLKDLETRGRWVEASERLIGEFLDEADSLDAKDRDAMRDALDNVLLDRARSMEKDPVQTRNAGLPADTFNPQIENDADDRQYAVLFAHTKREIRITERMPVKARRALCRTSLAARDLLWRMGQPARVALAVDLQHRVDRWDNYVEHGFKPTPVELLANGLMQLSSFSLEPPWWQVVLLHPSLGVEAHVPKSDPWRSREWQRVDVATMELLGGIVYNDTRTQYYGLSWTATFPADEGIGWGVMAHVGRVFAAGPIWRSGSQGRQAFLVLLDLYSWMSGVPARLEAGRERAKERLRSVMNRLP